MKSRSIKPLPISAHQRYGVEAFLNPRASKDRALFPQYVLSSRASLQEPQKQIKILKNNQRLTSCHLHFRPPAAQRQGEDTIKNLPSTLAEAIKNKSLKSLSVSSSGKMGDQAILAFVRLLRNSKNLTSLSFDFPLQASKPCINEKNKKRLMRVLRSNKNLIFMYGALDLDGALETLSVSLKNAIKPITLDFKDALLSNWADLRFLTVKALRQISLPALSLMENDTFLLFLRNNQDLECLTVWLSNYDKQTLNKLGTIVSATRIRHLHLRVKNGDVRTGKNDLDGLEDTLQGTHLYSLNLLSVGLSTTALKTLRSLIQNNTNLSSLTLRNNAIFEEIREGESTQEDINNFLEALENSPISSVDLSANRFWTTDDAKNIQHLILHKKNLTYLNLNYNKITRTEDFDLLIESLEQHPSLKQLDLLEYYTKITVERLEKLLKLLNNVSYG